MPIVQLEQPEAEDEREEEEQVNVLAIVVAMPRPSRKKTTKLDLKGKVSPPSQKSQRPRLMKSH